MNVALCEAELRKQLMDTNEQFKRLAAEHQAYDKQLAELTSRHHLTEEEHVKEITLKKKKLLLKDQMYSMVQKYRKDLESES